MTRTGNKLKKHEKKHRNHKKEVIGSTERNMASLEIVIIEISKIVFSPCNGIIGLSMN